MSQDKKKSTARDMTSGPIAKQIILFALPLMLGNVFQMLYNTVDSIVVGRYVGTQALAAVGSTAMITNMAVLFLNGFSVGAGVITGKYFGARQLDRLHTAVETTMASTFVLCVVFTVFGILGVRPMLRFMSTPEDVFGEASVYLTIYFAGITGLLIYNIGSGILRAVGDTTRPLFFLILTSVLNILLDLLFVLVFRLGIAGVAIATILSQFISAVLILLLLSRTDDIYRLTWSDLKIDAGVLAEIVRVGIPTGIQSVITCFSNVFVQSYINYFGSSVMAGWACYNKIDQFIMLPMSSMAMAATTFVSQNTGADNTKRSNDGTRISIILTLSITFLLSCLIRIFSRPAVGLFSPDADVIEAGAVFVQWNVFFLQFNCVNHVLAGALRGRGDSLGPMIIMLIGFVAFRQTYLFLVTHFVANTPAVVGFGYPVGWMVTCALEVTYFFLRWNRKGKGKSSYSQI